MFPLMRDLVDLVLTWWKRDRIRVRPSEGRLFRLRPGTVLCFADSPHAPRTSVEVVARAAGRDPCRPGICYFCRTSRGDGELIVTRGGGGGPVIEWFAAGRSCGLEADEIEIY